MTSHFYAYACPIHEQKMWQKLVVSCQILEFSCPTDINLSKKVSEKENIYGPLIRSMQLQQPDYKLEIITIIVRALGSIPTYPMQGIEHLGFTGKESNRIINKLQQKSIIGPVKICKNFCGFYNLKESFCVSLSCDLNTCSSLRVQLNFSNIAEKQFYVLKIFYDLLVSSL